MLKRAVHGNASAKVYPRESRFACAKPYERFATKAKATGGRASRPVHCHARLNIQFTACALKHGSMQNKFSKIFPFF
jgi:hypothetical protein